ncbi:MAG: hypothetical protein RI907_2895 [Pseudomonadota bacterium]|jgi:uncharacterized protein (UPF0276 family)
MNAPRPSTVTPARPQAPRPEQLTGIGLRPAHAAALLAHPADIGFVEVHAENFFGDDAATRQGLMPFRERWDVSLHGVGLSLGSAEGLDPWHLDRLAALVDVVQPFRVSDHASFARARPDGQTLVHAADLLPVARTPASIDILVRNIGQVQERLQRRIAIEHLSAYIGFEDDHIPEVDFLVEVCRRSGCALLLDLNNLVVNGLNRHRRQQPPGHTMAALQQARAEAMDFVWSLPPGLVNEIHLAGFRWPAGATDLVIDDHSHRVSPTVWEVYEAALDHLGPCPTLVEWDTDLPPLAVLLDEARLAAHRLRALASPGGSASADDDDLDGWDGDA